MRIIKKNKKLYFSYTRRSISTKYDNSKRQYEMAVKDYRQKQASINYKNRTFMNDTLQKIVQKAWIYLQLEIAFINSLLKFYPSLESRHNELMHKLNISFSIITKISLKMSAITDSARTFELKLDKLLLVIKKENDGKSLKMYQDFDRDLCYTLIVKCKNTVFQLAAINWEMTKIKEERVVLFKEFYKDDNSRRFQTLLELLVNYRKLNKFL